jgi:hypothetical protein
MASSVSVVNKRIKVSITNRKYASTSPTITAIWTTKGNELLAAKTHTPIATIPGSNVDSCLINEFHKMEKSFKNSGYFLWVEGREGITDISKLFIHKDKGPGTTGACCLIQHQMSGSFHAYSATVLRSPDRKDHLAIGKSEKRMVPTHTHIHAWVKLSSALTHNDRTGRDRLAAIRLNSEHLGLGISSIAG